MQNRKTIHYDDIHTKEKQEQLHHQFEAIAKTLHSKFPKLPKSDKCPCCRENNTINHYTCKYGYNLDLCKSCGHIFTNPFPSEESLSFFYNSDYKKFENKFFEDSFEKRIPIFEYRLKKLSRHLTPSSSLLDIGSALGIFLEAHKRLGMDMNIVSCDISKDACERLSNNYPGKLILNFDFMELPENKKFDCVSLWDTFEHIINPQTCLQKISALLNKNGIFAFSTPNTNSAEWDFAGKMHPQLLPPGHVNLYNKGNIGKILMRQGFKIESISTPNSSLDISFIKKHIVLASEAGNDSYSCKKFLSSMLSQKGSSEALQDLISRNNYAGNMFVIARKIHS